MATKPINFIVPEYKMVAGQPVFSKLVFSNYKFIKYLEDQLNISKVKVGIGFQLVKVVNYKVSKISATQIKTEVIIDAEKNEADEKNVDFLLGKTNVFSPNYLDAVKTIEISMHRDTPDESFLYYRNGVVTISKLKISPPVSYEQFGRYVWEDHILDRDFNIDTALKDGMFEDFIKKVSNNKEDRIDRLCTTIGYCLHDYKTAATSKAVVICDENVSFNPEGGSGKSLIHNALSKLRKTVINDGKSFNPKATFAWQKLDETIRLVVIDDARKGFDFEEMFSLVTSGFTNINKKNKDELELSVGDSPKIIITSNNVLKGGGGSFSRRQIQVELFQYFSKSHTPIDEYKTTFFTGWSALEWSKFDMFMAKCIHKYLCVGIVACAEMDWQKKDLIRRTSLSFAEWILDEEKVVFKNFESTVVLRDAFLYDVGQKNTALSTKTFVNYLKAYCEIYNKELSQDRMNNIRQIKIENKIS